MSSININVGTKADDGSGDSLRSAFISVRKMLAELYGITYTSDTQDLSGTAYANRIDHDELANRYAEAVDISSYQSTVNFDCSAGSVFEFQSNLTGTITIKPINYKKGQIITIYGLRGAQRVDLTAQGTSTNTFNKIGGIDYDDTGNSTYNILQIECVDDSATDPIFFYSLATYVSDSDDI